MTDPAPFHRQIPIDDALRIPVQLLPPALQPVAARFGALAHLAREIAADTTLSPEQRVALLEAIAGRLAGQPAEPGLDGAFSGVVEEFTTAALPCDADMHHAIHVLQACRQDVGKSRYRDWNELLLYCRYAAAPLGRFCLEALKEDAAAQAPAEALCCALALLIMLRDCGRDYRQRGLVYLPARWLSEAGCSVNALAAEHTDDRLRHVLAEGLDAADRLLVTARLLPRLIRDRRLRAASAAALTVAEKLAHRLRQGDPLADAIVLTRGDRRAALWRGRWRRIWR